MDEFELIGRLIPSLARNSATIVGAGDDCAVLDFGVPDRWLLLKTDAVVEGIHFAHDEKPERVGHKALARCLSDIAAMAGTAVSAVVTVGLPRAFQPEWVMGVYDGLNRLAAKYQVGVVGGETTTSPECSFLSVCVLGSVLRDRCILRSGAKPGDAIFVTGQLGGSLAGKHLDFEPRLEQAEWLASHFDVRSMIDLSDGLAGDLRHILTASQVGAELLASAIPISPAARHAQAGDHSPRTPLQAALTDGEDFELLFTVPSRQAVQVLDEWKTRFDTLPLTCIGKITEGPGLKLRTTEQLLDLTDHGYAHFA